MTHVAICGCPIPPEVESGEVQSLGWHLMENHPEAARSLARDALGERLRWAARPPTVEECELVGREPAYAEGDASFPGEWGDYEVETEDIPEAQAKLAEALEAFAMCDAAHVIPGVGVYLEE